ncbi:MAG: nucleotidyltransferase [Clostridia bacterium]|nr:nucleotidyltransferase [Clostridia bacterium]
MEKFEATLVIMAAGMGSRFGGLKQAEPVGKDGQAIVDYSVYDALNAGFTKIVFVIKESIKEDFLELVGKRVEKLAPVEYVYQELYKIPEGFSVPDERVKPWGTGHAVLCCKDVVKTPFAVINADDFYGASAFKQIYECLKNDTKNYCMVGFRLGNTVTENGTVSRGVCAVKDGKLQGVDECPKIDSECRVSRDGGNTWEQLSPDRVVSMNMWGFSLDFFDYLEEGFNKFLSNPENLPKTEFYVPLMVDELIKRGEKQVNVCVAEDKWYGVTYKEDKDAVVKALSQMSQYDNMYK